MIYRRRSSVPRSLSQASRRLLASHCSILAFLLKPGCNEFRRPGRGGDLPFIFPDLLGSKKGILGVFSAMRHSPSSLCHIQKSPTSGPSQPLGELELL